MAEIRLLAKREGISFRAAARELGRRGGAVRAKRAERAAAEAERIARERERQRAMGID